MISPWDIMTMFPDKLRVHRLDDWVILYKGPMMAPPEYWSPQIITEDTVYDVEGYVGDEITPDTTWVTTPR